MSSDKNKEFQRELFEMLDFFYKTNKNYVFQKIEGKRINRIRSDKYLEETISFILKKKLEELDFGIYEVDSLFIKKWQKKFRTFFYQFYIYQNKDECNRIRKNPENFNDFEIWFILNNNDKDIINKLQIDKTLSSLFEVLNYLKIFNDRYEMKQVGEKNNPSSNLKWDGTKYELCELIQALLLSNKIKENNKPVNQKRILEVFSQLFPDENLTSNNFSTNLKTGYQTNKRHFDSQFFINDLESIFLKQLKELIQKDSKQNKKGKKV